MANSDIPIESRIKFLKRTIKDVEEYLEAKKLDLKKNPDSLFYKGLVRNHMDYLDELNKQLKQLESELKNEIS